MSDSEGVQNDERATADVTGITETEPLTSLVEGDSLAQHLMVGLTANMQVMASNVGIMAEKIGALGLRVKEDSNRNFWRWMTTLIVIVIGAVFIYQNSKALDILNNATNPAAQARAAKSQSDALQKIDCDGEVNLILLTKNFAKTIQQITVPELSNECVVFYSDPKHPIPEKGRGLLPTTTTSTPS